jgi:hypothetical protein
MQSMFAGATAFNSSLANWNVSKVNNFIGMFTNATSFNQDLSTWTTTGMSGSMQQMFDGATAFNGNITNWNTELWATYRDYSYDDTKADYDDGKALFLGARFKF